MTRAIELRPIAQLDLAEAIGWYESKRPGLSFDFRLALDAVLSVASRYPDSYPTVLPGLRRAVLSRFPHIIYYRTDYGIIDVIAILHSSRNPRVWQARNH